MSEKRLPLFALLALGTLLIGGLITFVIMENKEEPVIINENENNNNTDEDDNLEEVYRSTLSFNTCLNDSCQYALQFKNSTLVTNYQKTEEVVNNTDDIRHNLVIDGKDFYNKFPACGGLETIEVIDDSILLWDHVGCSWGGNELAIFNLDGTKLFTSKNFEKNQIGSSEPIEYVDSYEIKGNNVYITVLKVYGEINGIPLCASDGTTNPDLPNEAVTGIIYELEYLGNNQFSTAKTYKNLTKTDYSPYCQ